ncbi:MAG: class I SAM-dependent methyltransferase [Roseburia sp.]|nr:class I SAM-dependent methyltransferase [Roseburia sp.]MCM1201632.1 class I SAM-dependent methyltransferase [Bacteroides fragilis]
MIVDRVLIWGTGNVYYANGQLLEYLKQQGVLQIVALVTRDKKEERKDGCPVIRKEEVNRYEWDLIVVAASGEMAESIRNDICQLGIDTNLVMSIWDYTKKHAGTDTEYYRQIVARQVNILKQILSASEEEVNNFEWMCARIKEYGIFPFRKQGEDTIYTQYGMMQIVEEFAGLCCYISNLDVKSAIEIGVNAGKSSYIMCALLSRRNQGLKYTCVDICDVMDSFDTYHAVLPALDKKIPTRSEDYTGLSYDFVFIDADHSYDASITDWENVGQYAKKVTCFHDIYAHEYDSLNGGVVRTWKEVVESTKDKKHKVFSSYPDQWMGIGVVEH